MNEQQLNTTDIEYKVKELIEKTLENIAKIDNDIRKHQPMGGMQYNLPGAPTTNNIQRLINIEKLNNNKSSHQINTLQKIEEIVTILPEEQKNLILNNAFLQLYPEIQKERSIEKQTSTQITKFGHLPEIKIQVEEKNPFAAFTKFATAKGKEVQLSKINKEDINPE